MPNSADGDQAGIRDAIALMRNLIGGRIVAAGHSYGGRQTTMLAAKEPELCDALIALSYPLHPPKKPDQLRTAHFPELNIPTLFVHGSLDGFGTAAEMQNAIDIIPAPTRVVILEHAGHDLKGGKFDISMLVIRELDAMFCDGRSMQPPSARTP